ncbi:MAG: threonylcarbamoyl-AMP synthase [Oligoflexia bacterium]|nr:threonylcarbamoyl-AMP synthase [Oligoflexia bacterium]
MIVDGQDQRNINKASELLKAGELVIFPTETVYGLGADALNIESLEKVFALKARPKWDPLIVHLSDISKLEQFVEAVPDKALKLAEKFWPGPLTLVLRKKKIVPDLVTGGRETVAIRVPRNPVAQSLLRQFGGAIAAPSANRFQQLSPTTALSAFEALGKPNVMVLDGGPCEVGLESTVVMIEEKATKILRPGGISREDIEQITGQSELNLGVAAEAPESSESPGQSSFHYAPRTPLKLVDLTDIKELILRKGNKRLALVAIGPNEHVERLRDRVEIHYLSKGEHDLVTAAANLYETLRIIDTKGFDFIICLRAPESGLGLAINDRMKKAQHGYF